MAHGPLVISSEPNLNLVQYFSQSGFNALLICSNEGSHSGVDKHLAREGAKKKKIATCLNLPLQDHNHLEQLGHEFFE